MTTTHVTDSSGHNGHEKTMHDKTPEEIQLEIAQTRSAITEDLRVLSERFSPQQLREGARDVMRDAREEANKLIQDAKEATIGSIIGAKDRAVETVKETVSEKVNLIGTQARLLGNQVGTQARLLGNQVGTQAKILGEQAKQASDLTVNFVSKNAMTVSLLGLGAGWLLMALRNYRLRGRDHYANEHHALPAERAPRNERLSPTVQRERDVVYHAPANTMRSIATPATNAADRARREARSAIDQTRLQPPPARSAVRGVAQRTQALASDNKLAVVALSVVAGLGLSLLLPVGRRPRRALLGAGERVWDGAQSSARQLTERVTHRERPRRVATSSSLS